MKIDSNYELSVAILFIGDSRVGKSNMIYRLIENKYSEEILASVGFDIKTKVMKICNKNILVKIFDTAGQERFNSITTSLFQKVQGIVEEKEGVKIFFKLGVIEFWVDEELIDFTEVEV